MDELQNQRVILNALEIRKQQVQTLHGTKTLAHNRAYCGWALPDLNQRSIGYEPIALTRLS